MSASDDGRLCIAVDGQALAGDHPTGLGRVARAATVALGAHRDLRIVPIATPRPEGFTSAGERLFWEQVRLPCLADALHADLLYSPAFGVPFFGRFPKLVMVHDLLPRTRAYETGGARWYWGEYLPWTATLADAVVTNSETTKAELCAAMPIDPARVHPLPLGAPWEAGAEVDWDAADWWSRANPALGPYVLFVGSLVERKRPETVIDALAFLAHERSPLEAVFVGTGPLRERLQRRALELGLRGRVHFLDYLGSDHRLQAIYTAAFAVVCPSEGEGFDLPGIEGACAGAPIVASELPVHREVLAHGASYFPIGDAPGLAQVLLDWWNDPGARELAAATALSRGARYSWRRHAAGLAELMRGLIAGRALRAPEAA